MANSIPATRTAEMIQNVFLFPDVDTIAQICLVGGVGRSARISILFNHEVRCEIIGLVRSSISKKMWPSAVTIQSVDHDRRYGHRHATMPNKQGQEILENRQAGRAPKPGQARRQCTASAICLNQSHWSRRTSAQQKLQQRQPPKRCVPELAPASI